MIAFGWYNCESTLEEVGLEAWNGSWRSLLCFIFQNLETLIGCCPNMHDFADKRFRLKLSFVWGDVPQHLTCSLVPAIIIPSHGPHALQLTNRKHGSWTYHMIETDPSSQVLPPPQVGPVKAPMIFESF